MGGRFFCSIYAIYALFVLILISPASCSSDGTTSGNSEERLMVTASIFPLADMVRQVGGEWVDVVELLPAGASPHAYEPTAAEAKQLAQANLVVLIGQGLDQFALELLAAHPNLPVWTVTADMELQPGPQTLLEPVNTAATDHTSHQHTTYDPHVWLDPILVRDEIAPRIAAQLQELDPVHHAYYQQNLERFQQELTALDREIRQEVSTFSYRKFIVFHSAWHYFARRYGLEDISVEDFPQEEPSARELTEIINRARKEGIPAIFAEPQFSPKAAQVVAGEFDGQVLTLDPLGGSGISGRDSYLALMRWNLAQLAEGLK